MFDLSIYLIQSLFNSEPFIFLGRTLLDIFGLFLSVLIALEILEEHYRLSAKACRAGRIGDCDIANSCSAKDYYFGSRKDHRREFNWIGDRNPLPFYQLLYRQKRSPVSCQTGKSTGHRNN